MRAPRRWTGAGGWWVVPAAVAVSVAVAVVVLRSTLRPTGVAGLRPPVLADTPSDLPPGAIVTAAPPDRLRALVAPTYLDPTEVDRRNQEERGKLLVSSDRVVGVAAGGEARAYPLRLLRWHEAVNDTLAGAPIAVTYSGLADLASVHDRRVGGEVIVLAVSGRLWQSSTLFYDRRPDGPASLWSPLAGRALAGPMAGTRLDLLPAALCTWGEWRRLHPQTTVLAPDPEADSSRLYRRDPYHSYFGSDVLHFPVDPLPAETDLRRKDRALEVVLAGRSGVFVLPRLAAAVGAPEGVFPTEIGGTPVRIHFRLDPPVAWAETADGRLPPQRFGFWFALHAASPELVPQPAP